MTYDLRMQRVNSRKSNYRLIPGARDTGQRFIVFYRDGAGEKRVFGFANDEKEREEFVAKIRSNPSWSRPTYMDRQKGQQ
jgi:hypothetical protein